MGVSKTPFSPNSNKNAPLLSSKSAARKGLSPSLEKNKTAVSSSDSKLTKKGPSEDKVNQKDRISLENISSKVLRLPKKIPTSQKKKITLPGVEEGYLGQLSSAIWLHDMVKLQSLLHDISPLKRFELLRAQGLSGPGGQGPLRVALMAQYADALKLLLESISPEQCSLLLEKEIDLVMPLLQQAKGGGILDKELQELLAILMHALPSSPESFNKH